MDAIKNKKDFKKDFKNKKDSKKEFKKTVNKLMIQLTNEK